MSKPNAPPGSSPHPHDPSIDDTLERIRRLQQERHSVAPPSSDQTVTHIARPASSALPFAGGPPPTPARDVERGVRQPGSRPAASQPADVVELLWHDDELATRVRRHPEWRPLIDALDHAPLDDELDDPTARDTAAIEDRREIFEVLAHGTPATRSELAGTLRAAARDGKLTTPLRLLAGRLAPGFDEIETLRATVAVATPFASADAGLGARLVEATELLRSPVLAAAPAVAAGQTQRVVEAARALQRLVAARYVEDMAERALLAQRHFAMREVFGGRHVLARISFGDEQAADALPAYLPEPLAALLPMFPSFDARLITEVRPAVDVQQTAPVALRVLALGRVIHLG